MAETRIFYFDSPNSANSAKEIENVFLKRENGERKFISRIRERLFVQ